MLIFHQWKNFLADRSSEIPDLPNKLRIVLLVADFTNHDKFVVSWPAWAVYGFALATKGSRQNHVAISHCWQIRCVTRGGAIGAVPLSNFELQILNGWAKIFMTAHSQLIIPWSFRWLIFCRNFCVRLAAWTVLRVPWVVEARRANTYVVIQRYAALSPLKEWGVQERNERGQRGAIARASNHYGGTEWLRGRQKVPTMSKMYFLQYSTFSTKRHNNVLSTVQKVATVYFLQCVFASKSPQVRQTCFLPRAPSKHVSPREVLQNCFVR